jgi:hypothetical protein
MCHARSRGATRQFLGHAKVTWRLYDYIDTHVQGRTEVHMVGIAESLQASPSGNRSSSRSAHRGRSPVSTRASPFASRRHCTKWFFNCRSRLSALKSCHWRLLHDQLGVGCFLRCEIKPTQQCSACRRPSCLQALPGTPESLRAWARQSRYIISQMLNPAGKRMESQTQPSITMPLTRRMHHHQTLRAARRRLARVICRRLRVDRSEAAPPTTSNAESKRF